MSKYEEFLKIQEEVLDESDYYTMEDEKGKSFRAVAHHGTLKLACEHEFTTTIKKEEVFEDGAYKRWEFTVAVFKDGKHLTDEVGSCDTAEKPTWPHHAIRSFGLTRAWMRAIKRAAYVLERLETDILPTETRVKDAQPPQPRSQPQPKPTQTQPRPPQPQPTQSEPPRNGNGQPAPPVSDGPDCACELGDVREPRKVDNTYVCGGCGHPINKTKRVQFSMLHSE